MLPYYEIPSFELGPFTIDPFGTLVVVAIVVGVNLAERRAERASLDLRIMWDTMIAAVAGGFVIAHLYSAIFYFPERVAEDPWYLLKFWAGISSFGGFLGGTLSVIIFLRVKKQPFWPYADAIAFGFAFAWIFGRLGCTLAFDHPGSLTNFFLAMPYPKYQDGPAPGVRHNLGFYELIWAVAISGWFWSQRHRPKVPGYYVFAFVLAYMPLRFLFDFLRAEDKRYGGLTAGQYAAIIISVVTAWAFGRAKRAERRLETST